jgi:hypothetical protein
MRRSSVLKELDAGTAAPELARRHGVHANTIRHWKDRYGGLGTNDFVWLKHLEEESRRKGHMIARLSPCELVDYTRSNLYNRRLPKDDVAIKARMHELALERPRWGWQRLFTILRRREGYDVGETRFRRLYKELQLQVWRRKKRKVNYVRGNIVPPVFAANERWSNRFHARPAPTLALIGASRIAHRRIAQRRPDVLRACVLSRGKFQRGHQTLIRDGAGRRTFLARVKIASNIGRVSLPVFVFWRLG